MLSIAFIIMQGSILSSDMIELSSEAVHNDQFALSCRVRRQLHPADNKTVEPFHHDLGLKAKVSEPMMMVGRSIV